MKALSEDISVKEIIKYYLLIKQVIICSKEL
jgi:hypothetical protein